MFYRLEEISIVMIVMIVLLRRKRNHSLSRNESYLLAGHISISNTTKWEVSEFWMAMFRNRFRGYTSPFLQRRPRIAFILIQSVLPGKLVIYRARRRRLGKSPFWMNCVTSSSSLASILMVIDNGLGVMIVYINEHTLAIGWEDKGRRRDVPFYR